MGQFFRHQLESVKSEQSINCTFLGSKSIDSLETLAENFSTQEDYDSAL